MLLIMTMCAALSPGALANQGDEGRPQPRPNIILMNMDDVS